MSDNDAFDPEDYEGVQPKMATLPRSEIRRLEKKAREAEQAKQELEQLRRERSFIKAGIPDEGVGKLFMKAYDGPDDVEAIKAAALEYGILQPPAGQQQQIQHALEGQQAAAQLAAGAPTPGVGDELAAKLRQAKSSAEVAQIMNQAGVSFADAYQQATGSTLR